MSDMAEKKKWAGLHAALLLCVPALIVGIALRVALTRSLPFAYFNQDVLDFLQTAVGMLTQEEFVLHQKKTVLVPLFYWLLSLTKWPLAVSVPLVQHALGCVLIAVTGLLGHRVFRFWKIFAPLLALLVAVDPNIFFYEHFLMAESVCLFCVALMAAAGAWFAVSKSPASFVCLLVFLFLTACTRPEGKLFALFPLLLIVLVEWKKWRRLAVHLMALAVTLLVHSALRSGSEGGLLLYTWVVHLTPEKLRTAPEFSSVIRPIADVAAEDWKRHDENLSRLQVGWQFETRRRILAVVSDYLGTSQLPVGQRFRIANKFCTKVAVETCIRRPFAALFVGLKKGVGRIREMTGKELDRGVLQDKTANALLLDSTPDLAIRRILVRADMRTPNEVHAFVLLHYPQELRWFNRLFKSWSAAINTVSLPRKKDWRFAGARWPAIPVFYILSVAGLIAAISQKSPLRPWHISLGVCFTCVLLIVFMTANVRGRFRFFMEPFWILYFLVFLDFIVAKMTALGTRRSPVPPSS